MGFEKHRFKAAANFLPKDCLCVLCNEVFDDPVQLASCQHVFCRKCIEDWKDYLREGDNQINKCPIDKIAVTSLVEAPKELLQRLGRLEVSCENELSGCRSMVKLEKYQNHLHSCPSRPREADEQLDGRGDAPRVKIFVAEPRPPSDADDEPSKINGHNLASPVSTADAILLLGLSTSMEETITVEDGENQDDEVEDGELKSCLAGDNVKLQADLEKEMSLRQKCENENKQMQIELQKYKTELTQRTQELEDYMSGHVDYEQLERDLEKARADLEVERQNTEKIWTKSRESDETIKRLRDRLARKDSEIAELEKAAKSDINPIERLRAKKLISLDTQSLFFDIPIWKFYNFQTTHEHYEEAKQVGRWLDNSMNRVKNGDKILLLVDCPYLAASISMAVGDQGLIVTYGGDAAKLPLQNAGLSRLYETGSLHFDATTSQTGFSEDGSPRFAPFDIVFSSIDTISFEVRVRQIKTGGVAINLNTGAIVWTRF